jgi:ornithine carbamoyltransferase
MHATAPAVRLSGDFLTLAGLPPAAVREILDLAAQLKRRPGGLGDELRGMTVALLFEKPSLRTRTTFEVGAFQLGGHPIHLGREVGELGVRETVADVARNLERWVNLIVVRTFAQSRLEELAEYAHIPVINALTDYEHPCQALADMLTLEEHLGSLAGRTLAYIGDGNNMAHALLHACAALGVHLCIATPPGYEPHPIVAEQARAMAARTGATITLGADPRAAAAGADAVYTDTWTSMGSEAEHDERLRAFAGFQVDEDLMAAAAPGALFMHCLPAHRGEEVAAPVIDGPTSVVFDQAENRLHTQKALMILLTRS